MARVLVAEDSVYMRGVVTRMVRGAGYEVFEAVDGDDCLRQLETLTPDLLLLDLVMPGRNGINVLGALAKAGLKFPVIVLTADIQDSVKRGCLDLGATAFINKPPQCDQLVAAMRQALGEESS